MQGGFVVLCHRCSLYTKILRFVYLYSHYKIQVGILPKQVYLLPFYTPDLSLKKNWRLLAKLGINSSICISAAVELTECSECITTSSRSSYYVNV